MRSVVGKENKIIYVIIFLLCLYGMPQRVCAREGSLPPHLIQTVNDQDIYEGLVALGFWSVIRWMRQICHRHTNW